MGEYKKVASDETIQFCHTPLICEGEGPEECKTVYESVCETTYHEHDVEDDVVECETVQEEKCEDKTQGYSTSTECTTWPVVKCTDVRKVNNKNTLHILLVKKNPDSCVVPPDVFLNLVPKNVSIKKRLSSKRSQKKLVVLSLKKPASL